MATQEVALRKRQQISKANRTMFLWVAAASALVGIGLVISVLLFQRAVFNTKVLDAKSLTARTLQTNLKSVDALKKQIQVMNTNQALIDSMVPGEDQPIRVVLDALPSDGNSSAFGSSLQQYFLNDPALTVETFNVDAIPGVESQDVSSTQDAAAAPTDASAATGGVVTFKFSVSTDAANVSALKSLLQKLERSIRAINVLSLTVEASGPRTIMTVAGEAYYEPAVTVQLKDKVIKP